MDGPTDRLLAVKGGNNMTSRGTVDANFLFGLLKALYSQIWLFELKTSCPLISFVLMSEIVLFTC